MGVLGILGQFDGLQIRSAVCSGDGGFESTEVSWVGVKCLLLFFLIKFYSKALVDFFSKLIGYIIY